MTTLNSSDTTYASLLDERVERGDETLRLIYPIDLLTKKSHFLELSALNHVEGAGDILQSVGRSLGNGTALQSAGQAFERVINGDRTSTGVQRGRHAIASIYLPIPEQFSEGSLEQKFNSEASLADTLVSQFDSSTASTLNDLGSRFNAAASLSQTVANKGYYVAYERPEFREYDMMWTLTPRNEDESWVIHNIVRWLKFYASPAKKGLVDNGPDGRQWFQGLTLSYPNEFRMRFIHSVDGSQAEDIWEPRPQTGYVVSLEVRHFDEGGQLTGFFHNRNGTTKHPVVTVLRLSFMENRLMWKNDFAGLRVYAGMPTPQQIGTGLDDVFSSNPE